MARMKESLEEIAALASGATTQPTSTLVPGLTLIKGKVPKDQLAALYEPMIGFIVQGCKSISIGNQVLIARAASYFVIPTEIPATASVQQGPNGLPYVSVGLRLNEEIVTSLLGVFLPSPFKRTVAISFRFVQQLTSSLMPGCDSCGY